MNQLSNQELRGMTSEQLTEKMEEMRRNLLELRLNAATSHIKTFSSDQRTMKRAVARILTHLHQKQIAKQNEIEG